MHYIIYKLNHLLYTNGCKSHDAVLGHWYGHAYIYLLNVGSKRRVLFASYVVVVQLPFKPFLFQLNGYICRKLIY